MAIDDCVDEIRRAGGGKLTDDQVLQILEAVDRRRRAKLAAGQLQGVDEATIQAARELGEEARVAALIEKRSRLLNVLRKQERFGRYDAAPSEEARALSAMNVGREGPQAGLAYSVDAEAQAIKTGLLGPMIGELRQAGLEPVMRAADENTQLALARELWRQSDPSAPASGNRFAEQAAGIVGRYQEAARVMQNKAGAWIGKTPGWIVRQSHDSYRIAHASAASFGDRLRRGGTDADFAAWHDVILPRLHERTFEDVGADKADRDGFLRQVWVNLVSGDHSSAHGGGDWLGGFKGPGNLARRASEERVLHFASADAWFEYNRRFGDGTVMEAVVRGLNHAARNTALMRRWGTNPEAAFRADIEQLARRARDRGDFKMHAKLNGWRVKAEFDALSGASNVPGDPTLAAWAQSARNLTTMAKLGAVVLSSIPDIAIQASALRHHGIGYLEGFGNGLASVLRGRGAAEQRAIADNIGVGIDGALGHMWAQFGATDGLPGRASKLVDRFFRLNLLTWWTDSMKTGIGLMLARNLARNAGTAWDALDQGLARSLGRYGIDAAGWAKIRASGTRRAGMNDYLTAEGIGDADLALKLRAYFVDTVNEAMTIAGAREQAIRTFGTRTGTVGGEAVRFVMQFKSFPITFAMRHIGRELGRRGTADVPGLALLIAGTTAMGYLSYSAKSIARGQAPADPLSPEAWHAALLQGGGLGIYGDFLFGQYNRFGGGGIETLLGPAAGAVGEALRIYGGAVAGEDVGAKAARFAVNQTPFVNLFYTRLALDYLVLYQMQEAMNPGFLKRFERNVERKQGKSFIIRPSQAIPRGGGERIFEGVRD